MEEILEQPNAWNLHKTKPYQHKLSQGVFSMALVEEYKIGNTRIKIYDDAYKDKTQEDIDMILKRITNIARNATYREEAS